MKVRLEQIRGWGPQTRLIPRVLERSWKDRGAGAAKQNLLVRRSRKPGWAGAAQNGTYVSSPSGSACSIKVQPRRLVEDEVRERKLPKGLGAHFQLVQRVERADVTSPVFFQEHLAAASVVRPPFGVFERVGQT